MLLSPPVVNPGIFPILPLCFLVELSCVCHVQDITAVITTTTTTTLLHESTDTAHITLASPAGLQVQLRRAMQPCSHAAMQPLPVPEAHFLEQVRRLPSVCFCATCNVQRPMSMDSGAALGSVLHNDATIPPSRLDCRLKIQPAHSITCTCRPPLVIAQRAHFAPINTNLPHALPS